MHVRILGSGSQGNALVVRGGETSLLVDAGLEIDALTARLEEARLPLHRLDAIALTHGHLDHARSSGELARRTGARLFCGERLMKNNSVRRASRLASLPIGRVIEIEGRLGSDVLELLAVEVPHDAFPTVAFRIDHGDRRFVHITDMGAPSREAARSLAGAHVLALEFNHDSGLLERGPYSRKLKRRVGGDKGHLSNDQAATMLTWLAGAELHTLVLTHLSSKNNTTELAKASARAALASIGRENVRILVAEQDAIGPNLEV